MAEQGNTYNDQSRRATTRSDSSPRGDGRSADASTTRNATRYRSSSRITVSDRTPSEPTHSSRSSSQSRSRRTNGGSHAANAAGAGGSSRTGRASGASRSGQRSTQRSGQRSTQRSADRQAGSRTRTQTSGSSRGARSNSSGAHGAKPSSNEVLRNRIIAIVILVALVALIIGLVTCVARGIGGGDQSKAASESAAAASASATSASAQSATAATASTSAQSAAASSGEGVESPWTSDGRFSTGDAELDQIIKTFCDERTKKDLSREDNAFNVYCEAVWSDYIERDDNQEPLGADWDIVYAKQFYNEGGGNCYEMAAFVEYLLKYFGYPDAQGEPCHVLRQSGTYGEHGLVFVTDTDGRKAMCDSSFGANGWMIDADSYTVKVVDVGQDPSEFKIADFEEVVKAYWA